MCIHLSGGHLQSTDTTLQPAVVLTLCVSISPEGTSSPQIRHTSQQWSSPCVYPSLRRAPPVHRGDTPAGSGPHLVCIHLSGGHLQSTDTTLQPAVVLTLCVMCIHLSGGHLQSTEAAHQPAVVLTLCVSISPEGTSSPQRRHSSRRWSSPCVYPSLRRAPPVHRGGTPASSGPHLVCIHLSGGHLQSTDTTLQPAVVLTLCVSISPEGTSSPQIRHTSQQWSSPCVYPSLRRAPPVHRGDTPAGSGPHLVCIHLSGGHLQSTDTTLQPAVVLTLCVMCIHLSGGHLQFTEAAHQPAVVLTLCVSISPEGTSSPQIRHSSRQWSSPCVYPSLRRAPPVHRYDTPAGSGPHLVCIHLSGGHLQSTEATLQPPVLGSVVLLQPIPRHCLAALGADDQVAPTVAHVNGMVGGGDRPLAGIETGKSLFRAGSGEPTRPAAPVAVTRLRARPSNWRADRQRWPHGTVGWVDGTDETSPTAAGRRLHSPRSQTACPG